MLQVLLLYLLAFDDAIHGMVAVSESRHWEDEEDVALPAKHKLCSRCRAKEEAATDAAGVVANDYNYWTWTATCVNRHDSVTLRWIFRYGLL